MHQTCMVSKHNEQEVIRSQMHNELVVFQAALSMMHHCVTSLLNMWQCTKCADMHAMPRDATVHQVCRLPHNATGCCMNSLA